MAEVQNKQTKADKPHSPILTRFKVISMPFGGDCGSGQVKL